MPPETLATMVAAARPEEYKEKDTRPTLLNEK